MRLILEQRYLFDGSAAAVGHQAAHADHHDPAHPQHDAAPPAGQGDGDHAPPAIGANEAPHAGTDGPARTGKADTVLFVDPRVSGWQSLVAGVKPGVDVVMLDPAKDGISQVTQALSGLHDVHNVEFLTEGAPGLITLGGSALDSATLAARASEIAGWSDHLAHNADIVFWGCQVGQGSAGAAFVADVHTLTGATVGASSDPTGAAALGGNWTLEVATGPLHRDVTPFTAKAMANYDHVLDDPTLTGADANTVQTSLVELGGTAGQSLNGGDVVTYQLTLTNQSSTAMAYDSGATLDLGSGLSYVAGSLHVTSGEAGTVSESATGATIAGITLAPGASEVVTFQVKVDYNLAENTPLKVSAQSSWDAAPTAAGLVAAFLGNPISVQNLAGPLDPAITVVGASNQTDNSTTYFDPTGDTSGTALQVTPGEITRVRLTEQIASGTNTVTMTVTLPTGLTYQNDGSVTVLLVTPNGDVITTLTGAGLQLAEGSTPANISKLDLGTAGDTSDIVVASLPNSAITVNGQQITFNLGSLSITNATSVPNYAIVEFNAVVGTNVADKTSLTATLAGTAGQVVDTPTQIVSTGYSSTNLSTTLDLPEFDTNLGTLNSMTLSLIGDVYTSGTITSTAASTATFTGSVKSTFTLGQATSGPALPSGSLIAAPTASQSGISLDPGDSASFNPTPGSSASDPATLTNSKTYLASSVDLTGYEAAGGGTIPVLITSTTKTTVTGGGGNAQLIVNTQREALVAVSYNYTSAGTPAGSLYMSVQAPDVTLAKKITNITYNGDGSATVTYVDTITNTGGATAYAPSLTDPGAGTGKTAYGGGASGTGVGASGSATGSDFSASLTSLGAGGSETFTYTVTIPDTQIGTAVKDAASLATVTWQALDPAHEVAGKEVLAGSSLTPPVYSTTAFAGLDLISGTVNQDAAATKGTGTPLTPLHDQVVTVTFTGQTGTESVTTGSDGSFTVLVPDNLGGVSVKVTAAGGNAPSGAVLDNTPESAASLTGTTPSTSGTNPVTLSFTPAADTNYTGLTFNFWVAAADADTAPVLANGPTAPLDVAAGAMLVPFAMATVADAELDASFSHDFSGVTMTLQRYISGVATPDAADTFTGTGSGSTGLVLSGGNVVWNGATVGSYTQAGGKLTILFAATGVDNTLANNVLQHIAYSYAGGGNALVPGIVLGVQIDDANNNPSGPVQDPSGPHDQGTGGDLLSNVLTATVDVHGTAPGATFTEPNDSNPAAVAVTVVSDADLSDIANTGGTIGSVTVAITAAHAEDVLTFTDTAKITGSYAGGTLTLTAVGGQTPTVADWQAALRSVSYYNSSDVPDTTARSATITVNTATDSAAETGTINVIPVNDSPILDSGIGVTLVDSSEYQGTGTPTPSGAVGQTVSTLLGLVGTGPGNVTDPDGAGLTGGATPGATGMAIIGFSTTDAGGRSVGTWYYSTDNGSHWTALPTVDAQHPLDLASTARLVFVPVDTNYNGQVPAALTFRAWDQFDGTASGTQADLTGASQFGQNAADNAAAGAYSIATDVLPLMVVNVNNAPTAAGSATLQGVLEGATNPPGATVSSLFGFGYGDAADQQFHATDNPFGSTLNPMAGIAITGNAATAGQGVWEYSVDNGAHWTTIDTTVSASSSIILPNTALLAFQPTANFAGTPGQLTVHLIDSSATTISGGLTGTVLAGATTAYTGIDVSTNGGSTAVSSGTMTLGTEVYAPILSIIGDSNNTGGHGTLFDPTGQTLGTAVTSTDAAILRMRAVLELPDGSNTNSSMTIDLPTGLTFANDGSTRILLVSPDGSFTTTLTGTGLQLTEGGTAVDVSKLGLGVGGSDPVTALLAAGAITVNGQQVTFNFGDLGHSDASNLPNYVIVEFNAVIGSNVADTTSLDTTMHGSASGNTTPDVHDYSTVQAPVVSLQKVIQGITYNPDGSATITYVDTVTNTGTGTGYDLTLDDPGAGTGTVKDLGGTGGGTSVTSGPDGTHYDAKIGTLGSGKSETFTYTVTIPPADITTAVKDSTSKATLTWENLDPTQEVAGKETLAGTSLTPPVYSTTAFAGLDLISGNVNQDVGATKGDGTPLTPLHDQVVTVTFTGQTGTESVKTGNDGSFTVLVPDNLGPVSITVTASGGNAPANDGLDNAPDKATSLTGTTPTTTGTNPAQLSFTPASDTNYTGLTFNFWTALDTAPVLANGPTGPLDVAAGATVVPFATATVADAELDASFSHDFSGVTMTLQRYVSGVATPDAADTFSGTGSGSTGLVLSGGNVVWNGATVGSYTQAGGKLTILFAATGVDNTLANNVLQHIAYSYAGGGNALVPGIVLGVQIDDANNDPIGLNGFNPASPGVHDQGPGGDLLSNVLTATVDVHGTAPGATFTEPNDSNPAAVAVTVVSDADLSDIANTGGTIGSVTVAITAAHAEDVLAFTDTAKITGSYAGGTLTLTAVGGQTPTVADWQAALRSVSYYNSSDVPDTTARSATITVNTATDSAAETGTINVIPVNDSPILDSGIGVTLVDSSEYQGTGTPTPSGAVGQTVSTLLGLVGTGPGNVTDPDGAGLTGGATPGATGMAIIGFSTTDAGGRSVGTWYYSTDNGSHWTALPTVDAQHPLDLASTARLVFVPVDTNYNGQVPAALTFRAWDQFDGTASGTQADLTGASQFGQNAADNAAAGAYSIATDVLPLMVVNVNNAPTAAGSVTLPTISTAEQHPTGGTVGNLFGFGYGDAADQQYHPTDNPFGSTANPMAGVAVTGNAATASQGVWEYSLDGGAHWIAISTSVSATDAIILPNSAKIAFQPLQGFSGTPGQLTVHLIDSSPTTISGELTGALLRTDIGVAFTGIDVSANGGSSAVSAGVMTVNTLVTALPPVHPTPPPNLPPDLPPSNPFPSDMNQSGGALGLWHTTDYLSRPIIPELALVGSVANRFIIVEQRAVIAVPPNIFQTNLDPSQLSFDAKLPDGSPLPDWLVFDPRTMTFNATPPASAYGRVIVLIRATDIAGNTADATFNILIGRRHEDLAAAFRNAGSTIGGFHLPAVFQNADAGHGSRDEAMAQAAPERAKPPAPVDAAVHPLPMPPALAHAAILDAPLPPIMAAGGLTSALREAGPMGVLGRARALLDSLAAAGDRAAA